MRSAPNETLSKNKTLLHKRVARGHGVAWPAVVMLAGLSSALPLAGQRAPTEDPPRVLTTPDGSRCILLPTAGPPIVNWVVFTPAGPLEDPEGLEGLAVAVARAP